jgi:aryl-alcohol dehydrogenase-like predicted oxidoreductase
MVPLEDITRIGFGGYRVDVNVPQHLEAMRYAFSRGCNLVDTASTYSDGRSERLVGQVLEECTKRDVFVITKAAYAQGSALQMLDELQTRGFANTSVVRHSPDFAYSLHPDFLLCQIEASRRRLKRDCVDGFLVHNPEHYIAGGLTHEELNVALRPAFEMLEELVEEGIVRYYGISSNHLNKPNSPTRVDLHRVLAVAQAVSSDHHFKLIQFPCNLLEQDACTEVKGERSLVQLAREAGLRTLSNRALNAMSPIGFIRLASWDDERDTAGNCLEDDKRLFRECYRLITTQLSSIGSSESLPEIGVLAFLERRWLEFDNGEALDTVFQEHFYPFVSAIYVNGIPEDHDAYYRRLYARAQARCRQRMAEAARRAIEHTIGMKVTPDRPLQLVATEFCLSAGIDHVLLGMRRVPYVKMFEHLITDRVGAVSD